MHHLMSEPFVSITDTATVKGILVAAGVPAEILTMRHKPDENLTWYTFEHDSRYWIASHHRGNPKPEDNGFCLIGISTSEMTKLEAAAFFEECINDFSDAPVRKEPVELSPVKS